MTATDEDKSIPCALNKWAKRDTAALPLKCEHDHAVTKTPNGNVIPKNTEGKDPHTKLMNGNTATLGSKVTTSEMDGANGNSDALESMTADAPVKITNGSSMTKSDAASVIALAANGDAKSLHLGINVK